jgi:hypothetical protein
MNKKVELPIIEPVFSTYHYQCMATAIISSNPSIRNWALNENITMWCEKSFLWGVTTPYLTVQFSSYEENPHLEKHFFDLTDENIIFDQLVQKYMDNGYYFYFNKIDDFYLDGKTWYKERHFFHDGILCGYDQENKLYCIYAYDNRWKYTKLWIPQESFNDGIRSMRESGEKGYLYALKPMPECVEFNPTVVVNNLKSHINTTFEVCPPTDPTGATGLAVHDYILLYLDKLLDNSIPHERMDWRIFRVIWEHKKLMLERIERMEEALSLDSTTSDLYKFIVEEANKIRLLYASYHMKRRDSLLVSIKEKLIEIKHKEKEILEKFIEKAERKI